MTNPTPQDREMGNRIAQEVEAEWLAGGGYMASRLAMLLAEHRLSGYRQGIEDAAKVVEQRGQELQARAVDVDRTCAAIRKLGEA